MNNPLVSIIITTYNRSQLLAKTIESVCSQEYEPVEIIVIDDGSTDNTRQIAESFGHRVEYYKKKNEGIAKSRTFGCRLAKGEYIAFQDDDDIMPPDRITVLLNALFKYPSAIFATGDFIIIDEEGNLTDHRWLPEGRYGRLEPILFKDGYEAVMWPQIPAAPHTSLFKRSDGEKIGWFDEQLTPTEDKDFFARLGRLGPVVYLPKVVSYYRRGHDSLTNDMIITAYKTLHLLKKHLSVIEPINTRVKKRLQVRIMIELKKIDRFIADGNPLPKLIPRSYSKQFLPHMDSYGRIKYNGYRLLRLPIRRIIKTLKRSHIATLGNILN
jgi:glycosyltransferase involved in cell wall biosynthesis